MKTQSDATPRPTFITAVAVLLFVIAFISFVYGLLYHSLESTLDTSWTIPIILLGVAALAAVVGWGLLRLKEWARLATILLAAVMAVVVVIEVGIFYSAYRDFSISYNTTMGSYILFIVLFAVLGLGLAGYIIYWFARHRAFFRP